MRVPNVTLPIPCTVHYFEQGPKGSRLAQRSKPLHLSARGINTVTGSNPGCITSGRDWESHRVVHNWPNVTRVGRHCK